MRALVTGGAKRLGKEIAIFLAERGFEVAIHYHSSEKVPTNSFNILNQKLEIIAFRLRPI